MSGFKFIEHPADIEITASGGAFTEALKYAIYGMVEVIADREKIMKKTKREIEIDENDLSNIVFKTLDEILYLFDTEGFLPKEVNITKNKDKYKIEMKGMLITGEEDFLRTEIKAVTYHNLHIKQEKDGWKINVLFDI